MVGAAFMAGASFGFGGMTVMVKLMNAELPEQELVFWRSLFALPLILAVVLRARRDLIAVNRWSMLRRTLFGFAAMLMFFYALSRMTLAESAILIKLQPIWVALLAPLVVGERPGGKVWAALTAALAGAFLVLGPSISTGVISLAGLAALGASLFSALAHLELRRLGRTDHSEVVVLNFTVLLIVFGGLLSIPVAEMPEPSHWPLLAGLGLFATIAQFLMTRAYQSAPAPLVATIGYLSLPVAALLDWAVFQTIPSWWTVFGGLLIIAAGVALVLGKQEDGPPPSQAPGS